MKNGFKLISILLLVSTLVSANVTRDFGKYIGKMYVDLAPLLSSHDGCFVSKSAIRQRINSLKSKQQRTSEEEQELAKLEKMLKPRQ